MSNKQMLANASKSKQMLTDEANANEIAKPTMQYNININTIQSNVNQREGIEKKLSLFPEQRGLKHENDKRGGSN